MSVILPALDGGARAMRVLDSLCGQTFVRDRFEVVVVQEGESGAGAEVERAFGSRLPLRLSRQRRAGVASAWNHGLFLARGVIVLFLEGDVAEPALLERHADAHRRFPEPRIAVQGRTALDPSLADDPLMSFLHGPRVPSAAPGGALDWRHFRAEGSSFKRGFLLDAGTFDSSFPAAGEDAELGHRLSRRGFEIAWEPGAVTRVVEPLGIDELCRRTYERGRAHGLLARLRPTPAVRAWTGAAGAWEAWRELAPAYPAILRSARTLDRLFRLRIRARLPIEDADRALLHRSYREALRASELKGLCDEAAGAGRVA